MRMLAREEAQERERRRVRRVKVFEDERDRRRGRRETEDEVGEGLEEREARLRGIDGGGVALAEEPRKNGRRDLGARVSRARERSPERPQDVDPRPVRRRTTGLCAAAPRHRVSLGGCSPRGLRREP